MQGNSKPDNPFSHYIEKIARLVESKFSKATSVENSPNQNIQTNNSHGKKSPIIIAIDGRSASGKSTLAGLLSSSLSAPVIHTDDFYLPLAQRTEQIMSQYFGHMDLERLRKEVLIPLFTGEPFSYRPFSCKSQMLLEEVHIPASSVVIIEGTYSLFPSLLPFYDIKIFLDTKSQRKRLLAREGEDGFKRFSDLWIPREEEYFSSTHPEKICDLVIVN